MKGDIDVQKNGAEHFFPMPFHATGLLQIGSFSIMLLSLTLALSLVANAYDIPIVNPGFEEGKTGWDIGFTAGNVCSFSLENNSFSGTSAAKVAITSSGGYCSLGNPQSALVGLTGTYKLSMHIRVSGSPGSILLAVWRAYDSQTFPYEPVKSTRFYSLSSSYQLCSLEDIPLSAGEYVRLEIGMDGGPAGSEMSVDSISLALTECNVQGDVNGDCVLDPADVILALRVISNQGASNVRVDYITSGVDVNDDGRVGFEEAIYALRVVAGMQFDPVGDWVGTLSGYQGSGELLMSLMADQKVIGSIDYFPLVGGKVHLFIDSTYSSSKDTFNFSCSGTATYRLAPYPNQTSEFNLVVNGSLASNTEANGTYTINFDQLGWTDDSGKWSATNWGKIGCFTNDECPLDWYCEKDDGDCSGQGHCAARAEVCPCYEDLVCGCDGKTYSNRCYAAMHGVSIAYEGMCTGR